jgi:hypothetical protein
LTEPDKTAKHNEIIMERGVYYKIAFFEPGEYNYQSFLKQVSCILFITFMLEYNALEFEENTPCTGIPVFQPFCF